MEANDTQQLIEEIAKVLRDNHIGPDTPHFEVAVRVAWCMKGGISPFQTTAQPPKALVDAVQELLMTS